MIKINGQSISDFWLLSVYGMLKGTGGVAVYKGQVLTKNLIIIEGMLVALNKEDGVNKLKQLYDTYKNGATLTAFNTTKQAKLKDINILRKRDGLNRVYFDVALVFEEV